MTRQPNAGRRRVPPWLWVFFAVWLVAAGGVVEWGRRVLSSADASSADARTASVSAAQPTEAPDHSEPEPEPEPVGPTVLPAPSEPEIVESADPVIEPPVVPPPPLTPSAKVLPPSAFSLVMPVLGVEPAELRDTFTDARSGGRRHDAIDIHAPRGTPVLAAVDGELVRFFESERGGLTIYQVADDESTVLYYAHLDAYAEGLETGDDVDQGSVIGYVGDTGNAQPGSYHLHFALWTTDDPDDFWDGESINPYPLLAR